MDSFIKKIFENKLDNLVHLQFQKFSRGEFGNRAMIKAKNSKGKYTINTSAEYAKNLVISLAEKLKGKTNVTGALISALDLDGFEYKEKKSAIGVRKYIIDSEMTGDQILELCKIEKAFVALSFKTEDSELKIKPKSPKSSKSSGSGKKEIKIDFCKLKTTDISIVNSLIFDKEAENGKFKEVLISHTFIIDDIVIPDELKNEKDFSKVREHALRKGKIIRKLEIKGETIKKEKDFEV